jgi:ABC-2 type transport system ATP-binding protein
MKKQAAVMLAIASRPKYLLCDETFDGLDPVVRQLVKRIIAEEAAENGMTTIIASHNLREMEDICDSVGFLHEGKLVCSGDLDSLLSDVHRVQLIPAETVTDEQLAAFRPLRLQRQGRLCMMTLRGDRARLEMELNELKPMFMEFLPLSLEEVFILEMEDRGYAQH